MKLIIGILAWNEEESLPMTIRAMARQSIFRLADEGIIDLGVFLVPNGCTDRTSEVAADELFPVMRRHPLVDVRICEIERGGKANAWNQLVHRLAPPDADFFLMMDADVEPCEPDALERLWRALLDEPDAIASSDTPVKHIERMGHISWRDRILLDAGSMTKSAPGQLSGQLYCARGEWLRKVWIPEGILVEDGFLKQILCTNGFSEPPVHSRIVRAEGVSHVFECYTRWKDIWNHQVRQAAGQTIFSCLRAYVNARVPERPAFEALAALSRENSAWFLEFLREEIRRRGWWVMDSAALWMRWRRVLLADSLSRAARFACIAAIAFPFDLAVFMAANRRLKTGRIAALWKDTRTTALGGGSR